MASTSKKPTSIIVASILIVGVRRVLAFAAAGDNKSYYVTISELQAMGGKAYTRHLRVAGNVQPGSIQRVRHERALCAAGAGQSAERRLPGHGAAAGYV